MKTILLLASIQAFFLVALLLGKRNNQISDKVLGTWLGLIGAHTLILYCFAEFQLFNVRLLNLNSGVPFLQGPFLFYYVDTLTSSRIGLKKSYAWHLIPYVAFVAYQLFFQNPVTVTPHDQHVDIRLFDVSFLSNLVLLLSVPFYAAWSLLLLKNYRQRMLNTFSTTDRINLNWLRYLVTAMFLVWLAVLVFVVIQKLTGANSDSGVGHLIFAPISLFVYATGYFGFKQTTIFSNVPEPDLSRFDADATTKIVHPSPADTPDSQPAPKYQKSGLKENKAARTLARLLKHMVDDEPFLDDQLTLPQVAAELYVSVNHLSQVINDLREENFFDFVNSFRVEAVKQKLRDPKNDAFSLLAIGLDCGFGSKSSFNRIFKNATGLTPSQYKKSLAEPRP